MSKRPTKWIPIIRRTLAPMTAVIAGLALAGAGWRVAAESLSANRLPLARPESPNVLLLVLDTVRAANLSVYGYEQPTTPELERWAADGVTFQWAFSTASWTLKSHATMFTGLYPSQMAGDFETPVDTPAPMLAEIFRDRGYATAGFVANLAYTSRESGLARGFVHYDDFRITPRQAIMHSWIAHTPLFRDMVGIRRLGDVYRAVKRASLDFEADSFNGRTYGRKTAGEVSDAFLDWQSAHGDRPFFAFLNYFDAHVVYRPPPSFERRFALKDRPTMGRYDGAIAYIDQEIGRMLGELRQRGLLDNTIVIVTSDHGEQFGEHGLKLHANSLYLPLLHVPLVIRYPPRVVKGGHVETPVTLRDLAATVIDLAGLVDHVRMPGSSLATLWSGGDSGQRSSPIVAQIERVIRPEPDWPVFFGPMQSVIDRQFHYIRRGDGAEELYDYRADLAEAQNLGNTPGGQQEISRLRALLNALPEH